MPRKENLLTYVSTHPGHLRNGHWGQGWINGGGELTKTHCGGPSQATTAHQGTTTTTARSATGKLELRNRLELGNSPSNSWLPTGCQLTRAMPSYVSRPLSSYLPTCHTHAGERERSHSNQWRFYSEDTASYVRMGKGRCGLTSMHTRNMNGEKERWKRRPKYGVGINKMKCQKADNKIIREMLRRLTLQNEWSRESIILHETNHRGAQLANEWRTQKFWNCGSPTLSTKLHILCF